MKAPKLTQKDFEAIARILRETGNEWDEMELCRDISERLADYLATTNPKFDRARFLQAAGVDDDEGHDEGQCQECLTRGEVNECNRCRACARLETRCPHCQRFAGEAA